MVFQCNAWTKVHRLTDNDSLCDDQSIGSTISKNHGTNRPKIERGNKHSGHCNEWYVVPTGGEKARANNTNFHPNPCRYDEYERYLTATKTIKITSTDVETWAEKNRRWETKDTNHSTITYNEKEKKQLNDIKGSYKQERQKNTRVIPTGAERRTGTRIDNSPKWISLKPSTCDNNNKSSIVVSGETTHQNRDTNMDPETVIQAIEAGTRGRHGCQNDNLRRHQSSEEGDDRNHNNENNGGKEKNSTQDNGNNDGSTQQDATDATQVTNNGETGNEGNNSGTSESTADVGSGNKDGEGTSNNEKWKERRGDNNNSEQDNNNEGSGNGYEEQASQTTPAFDNKVLQKFVIDFKMRDTPAATIGFIHKEFIKEVLTVAPSTSFVASNTRTIPTPATITTIDQFPSNHLLHQKFFHRVDIRDKVSFTHDVYSSVTAMEIKRRLMPFLQEHNIGMWSEEISNNTKVRVCWILNAHSKVSYRPLMTDKLCKGIDEQKENYGDENNRLLNQLPKKMHHIEVQTRTVTHQGHQTVACCVMGYKPAAPVIRELVAMLDHDYLGSGTSIVSEAAARELDPGKYIEIINSNTAFHQNTRTISVKYVHDLFWGVKYRPCEQANYTTVREWIMTGSGVVSIEPTKDTEKDGRYIILCKAEGFPVFRRLLQVMFQTLAKTIEEDEDLKRTALNQFQQYPTIIGPHKIGRYAEKNAKGLLSRIDVPTVPKPAIRPPSNKIEFDFGSAEGFPGIPSPAGIGVRSRRASVKKTPKQQTWATVAATPTATTYTGNASVGSEPSEAGKSYHSVRTGITNTDQQTAQSEALYVLTEFISQARQEDAERRKEEREERRIDREDRKLEAEERRRNEDRRDENNRMMFQTMMATILSQTGSTAAANNPSHAPRSPITLTNNKDNANWIIESNKKRNRKNDTQDDVLSPETTQQDRSNRMEVEENVVSAISDSGQQHHDVQENNGSPLLH